MNTTTHFKATTHPRITLADWYPPTYRQSSQPPIPFTILKIWHNCNAVFLRWRTDAPGTVQPEQPVTGIIAIETVPNPKKRTDQQWLIKVVYSEFNSGAWLYDLGIFKPECKADGTPANPPPTIRRI